MAPHAPPIPISKRKTDKSPWADLIGKKVTVVFDLPSIDWPIEGYPAFAILEAVDMPLIKLKNTWGGDSLWINAKFIKTIQ